MTPPKPHRRPALAMAAAALTVSIPSWAGAQEAREEALASLVAAERGFAAAAAEVGVGESFLRNIADDGVLFRPDPVNGRAWLEAHPSPGRGLSWYPRHARVAASGDLGFTTGPWVARDSTGAAVGHGHYFTVWRRDAGGAWKFLVDQGTPHPAYPSAPAPWSPERAAYLAPPAPAASVAAARESLRAADAAFGEQAGREGLAAALEAHGSDDVWLLRPRAFPAEGKSAALAAVRADPRRLTAAPEAAHVSRDGGFGWVYGRYRLDAAASDAHPQQDGWYLRVWAREGDGPWRLLADLMTARRPERQE